MKRRMDIRRLLGVVFLMLLLGWTSVAAETYPDRPIKVLHGWAPGGGADLLLRALLPKVEEVLGQTMVIEYHPGAGGIINMGIVAKAKPDGYTLLMGTPGLAINPHLYETLPYDRERDFAPICLIGRVANVLVVHPSVPVNSVRELIDLAKSKPGKLNYASSGIGTSLHLAFELFKVSAGLDIMHVPYKGGLQAVTGVLGGQVEMMFNVLPSALPHIKAGKLKALAVTGKTRSETLPECPTMIEAGVPGYLAFTWNGILAPKGTPQDIITKLNGAFVKVLRTQEMKERFGAMGQEPWWSTPEEFSEFMRKETEKWAKVVKAAGIKPR